MCRYSFTIIFLSFIFTPIVFMGQDIHSTIDKVYLLIEDEKYQEGYDMLQTIDQEQVKNLKDSVVMMYNYEMGTCLYNMDLYEKAIPYLNEALLKMEKLPHEDCTYLEIIYGIGSCYNKLKLYQNAEKYFRRVMIRGNVLAFKCKITTQTLSELTEVYNKLGYTKLAKECAEKISSNVEDLPSESWPNRVELLLDLAESYEEQNRFDEEIETYHKILQLIDSNIGKENEDYLTYSSILFHRLLLINRTEDAISVLMQMIDIGKNFKNNNTLVCNAYENYLELSAKKNDVEIVEKLLPDAVKYIQHTKEYDWQTHNLYERIGNAFSESGNHILGAKYLEKPWNGKFPNNIRSLGNLGVYYYKTNPQKSLEYYKKAESLINDSTNSLTRKIIYYDIYSLYSKMQKTEDAVRYAKLSAPYIKEVDGIDTYAKHLTMWALDSSNINHSFEAQRLFEEVKDLFPTLSNKTRVTYYSQYGFYLLKTKEISKATDVLKEGVRLCVEVLGEDDVLLTTMYHNLGRAYMLKEDYANALFYLNKSRDLQIQLNGNSMQRTLDYITECESK